MKDKLIGSTEYCVENDTYSPHDVVEKMLLRRDRKIPGSVFKPHSDEIILLQSVALGQPQPSARVFFPYPKYCFKDTNGADLRVTTQPMLQGEGFLQIIERHKGSQLQSFQKV